MHPRTVAIVSAAALTLTAGTAAVTAATAGAATNHPPPHCARVQNLCDVIEYVTVQPGGVNQIWTCYLNNPAYKPSRYSIRIALYRCITP